MIYITYRKKKKKRVQSRYLVDRAGGPPSPATSDIWSTSFKREKKTECRREYWSTPVGRKKRKRRRLPRPTPPRTRAGGGAREWRRRGNGDRERERKREKEEKRERRQAGSAFFPPRPPAKKDPPCRDGRAVAIRARRDPTTDRRDTSTATPHTGLAKAGSGAGGKRSTAGPRAPPPRREERKSGRGHTPSSGDGGDAYVVGGGSERDAPPTTPPDARVRAGAGGRRVPARPAETNPCVEG